MSTCKDCIHAEVCPDKDNVVRPCYFFKDRSKYVNIPSTISIEDLADAYEGIGKAMLNFAKRLREGQSDD